MKDTKSLLLTGVRAAVFAAVTFGAASAMAWTAAPASPPANNVATPLNTSATTQAKLGELITNYGGYIVDLSRGDVWPVVTNGNVYAADVYSSASGKWLSDSAGAPHFISPVTFYSIGATGGWGVAVASTTFDASPYIPAGATSVILQADYTISGPDSGDIDSHVYIGGAMLAHGRCAGDEDSCGSANQGTFPLNTGTRSFTYSIDAPGFNNGITLRVIGYF